MVLKDFWAEFTQDVFYMPLEWLNENVNAGIQTAAGFALDNFDVCFTFIFTLPIVFLLGLVIYRTLFLPLSVAIILMWFIPIPPIFIVNNGASLVAGVILFSAGALVISAIIFNLQEKYTSRRVRV